MRTLGMIYHDADNERLVEVIRKAHAKLATARMEPHRVHELTFAALVLLSDALLDLDKDSEHHTY